jgi:hypothetical protein
LLLNLLCIFMSCNSISKTEISPHTNGIKAVSANTFLNSMGVCSSISGRGETLEGSIEALNYTGIRWVRCGLEDDITTSEMITLRKKTDAKIAFGLLSGNTNIAAIIDTSRILAGADALLAIEGNNEPNNWPIVYKGQQGGGEYSWLPVSQLQNDLYKAVKTDAVLQNYPVWNISESGAQTDNVGLQFLIIPDSAKTKMPGGTRYADYANCHNYITHPAWPGLHDNQTWLSSSPGADCPVDGLYANYGLTWKNKFEGNSLSQLQKMPRVTTETGYSIDENVTEEIQARLFLNLYLSQFKRGWSFTAIYLLRTRSNEPHHEPYAIFKKDYTPKIAAHYLHHLTTILEDRESDIVPGQVNYSIPDQPETVHDLLLQKANGTYFLVIWGERFAGGSDTITVNPTQTYHTINIYDPTVGTSSVKTIYNAGSVKLSMTNHPIIIELKN